MDEEDRLDDPDFEPRILDILLSFIVLIVLGALVFACWWGIWGVAQLVRLWIGGY